jgi:acyl-CoA reductase-like NAD-dependent aldehyde dehydrogenase
MGSDSTHNAMGPVVSKQQYEKVMGYIETAKADPACSLIAGGGRPKGLEEAPGYFVEPTIFEVGSNDAKIWKEEIFGPVLSVRTFQTEEEAVAMANDTTYGLADGVFSQDVERATRVANQLRAGILYVNQCMTGVGPSGGGFKMSGIGREGGMEGFMEYVQSKSVSVNTGLNRPSGYARELVANAEAPSARL